MAKKSLVLTVSVAVLTIGLVGFTVTTIVDLLTRPQGKTGAQLEMSKKMLRQSFEKSRNLGKHNESLNEKITELTQQSEEKGREILSLRQQLETQMNLVRNLTGELESEAEGLEDYEQEVSAIKEDLALKEDQLAELNKVREELSAQRAQIEARDKQIAALQAENTLHLTEKDSLKQEMETLKTQTLGTETESREKYEQLKTASDEIEVLQAALDAATLKVSGLEKDNSNLKKTIDDLNGKVSEKDQAMVQLQADGQKALLDMEAISQAKVKESLDKDEALLERMGSLREEINAKESQITTLTQSLAEAQTAVSSYREALTEKEQELEVQAKQIEELSKKSPEFESQVQVLQSELEAKQGRLDEVRAERDDLKVKLDTSYRDLDLLEEELISVEKDYQAQRDKLTVQLAEREKAINVLEAERISLQTELQLMQGKQALEQEKLGVTKDVVADLEMSLEDLRDQLNAQTELTAQAEDDARGYEQDFQGLREQLQMKDDEIARLTRESEKLKVDVALESQKKSMTNNVINEKDEKIKELNAKISALEEQVATFGTEDYYYAIRKEVAQEYRSTVEDLMAQIARLKGTEEPVQESEPVEVSEAMDPDLLEPLLTESAEQEPAPPKRPFPLKAESDPVPEFSYEGDIRSAYPRREDPLGEIRSTPQPNMHLNRMQKEISQLKEMLMRKDDAIKRLEQANVEIRQDLVDLDQGVNVADKDIHIRKLEKKLNQIEAGRDRDRVTYFYNLGVLYTEKADYDRAEEMYKKAIEVNPKDAAAHYNLAIIYDEHLDNNDMALKHYDRFLKLNPNSEKSNDVMIWRQMAQQQVWGSRRTRKESAAEAFDHLFLTTAS